MRLTLAYGLLIALVYAGLWYFLKYKTDTWLVFYTRFYPKLKKKEDSIISGLRKSTTTSPDVARYVILFITLFEDLVFDILRSDCMDNKVSKKKDINDMRKRVSTFMSSLMVYAYLENLEHINLIFMQENKQMFLDLTTSMLYDAYSESNLIIRREKIGNKLLNNLESLFGKPLNIQSMTDDQASRLLESSNVKVFKGFFPETAIHQ